MTGTATGRVVIGIGSRRGVRLADVRAALEEALAALGVRVAEVGALVTVEARRDEPALLELAELLRVPLRALPADRLAGQPVPNPSARVRRAVGTPSVAEAAVLASGAELLGPRRVSRGVTIAVGRRPAGPGEVAPGEGVDGVDLGHHGDAETGPGLVDLAVNVQPTPAWLVARLKAAVDTVAAYPDPAGATAAVAARHGRPVEQVLLTAGAAEAFVLLARVLRPRRAVVVHPQFTEPEAALRAAGHEVGRVVLAPPFTLDPDGLAAVPAEADLVVIGNPTNPTSVLHPARTLLRLARPGRVLVVDEAFMDAVPGEPESLAGGPVEGLVVVRSLTKTWGLAGVRIGYLLAGPELVAACRAVQPLWSVGALGLAAAAACSTPEAALEADRIAGVIGGRRERLLAELAGLVRAGDVQLATGSPRAPFVLLRAGGPDPAGVRQRLRAAGWAVRRADTFPGLGVGWLRVAVRDATTSAAFAVALERAVHHRSGSSSDDPVARIVDLRGGAAAVPAQSRSDRT